MKVLLLFFSLSDNMLNTLGSEGGRFVARQSEVSQPVLGTVGNISNTIHGSEFAQSVHQVPGTVTSGEPQQVMGDSVALATNTLGLVSSLSCAFLCPNNASCSLPLCNP